MNKPRRASHLYKMVNGVRIAKQYTHLAIGRLVSIGPAFVLPVREGKGHAAFQVFQCDCGAVTVKQVSSVKRGASSSCKCYQREYQSRRNTKHGGCAGVKRSSEYDSFSRMKRRCLNKDSEHYEDYGGRGITICARWLCPENGFANFYADMGPRPSRKHSIDRIDVDGNYCPENCRWATQKQQTNNTRRNVRVTAFGKTLTLSEWSDETGIKYSMLASRIRSGWEPERAIALPSTRKSRYDD